MPTGIPKHKYTPSKQALAIQQRIAELRERLKGETTRDKQRAQLVTYCKRRGITRADIFSVAAQLPLTRITRKHRLAQVKAAKKGE